MVLGLIALFWSGIQHVFTRFFGSKKLRTAE